ncbi:MAG: DUF488 domain-containing protein [Candidatus Brockarchaeota archaeon]|nr:DUF488 domain-containing protein [Candidatus Brockarchaeota archaeon]
MNGGKRRLTVWTIGHGSLSKDFFLSLLKKHGINLLVDVRRFPTSRLEHFRMESLEKWLPEEGVEYLWLGEELGGYRRGGYEKHMETSLFREGVEKLLDLARGGRVCIMCLETDPKYCHRMFIAQYLRKKGVRIFHISSVSKRVEKPKSSPFSLSPP